MKPKAISEKYKKKSKSKLTKILLYSFAAVGALLLTGALSLFLYLTSAVDPQADDALFSAAQGSRTTRILVREAGSAMSSRQAPDGFIEAELLGGEKMLWTPIEDIPPLVRNAFLAVEDRGFYEHGGVDLLRTARAALNSLFRFEKRFGASTVTQQTVKNLTGDNAPTFLRKIREIYRAYQMESRRSKDDILELYLNIIPFTDGCIGVTAASRAYFGKEPAALTAAEAAGLAAVTNAPATYNPRKNPERYIARRNLVLREMLTFGAITEEEHRAAVASPLSLVPKKEENAYSWYTEALITDITNDLVREKGMNRESALRLLYSGGLTIYSCMNPVLQDTLEGYFENKKHFQSTDSLVYAMTVIDPYTGDLLATVGRQGAKTESRILNYANDVKRPPGSALKPLALYAPALERGLVTWSTVLDDTPVSFTKTDSGYRMWPQNASRTYSGLTTLADALAQSKNTVAVRLYDALGSEAIYRTLTEDFGLSGILRRRVDPNGSVLTDLSAAPLALGQLTEGVTLRELSSAYTAFLDHGYRHKCRSYDRVPDRDGNILLDNTPKSTHALSAENAAIMTEMLRRVVDVGTARSLRFPDSIPIAGKTGTAGKGEDKWFVGYTPYLLAGIYCGSPDRTTAVSGDFKGHLSVYEDVMTRLHEALLGGSTPRRRFRIPVGVTEAAFCLDSGESPQDSCSLDLRGTRTDVGYFVKGSEPHTVCTRHIPVLYDEKGGGVATNACLHAMEDGTPHGLKKAALVLLPDRRFPTEVTVRDAEYMYLPIGDAALSFDKSRPFFQNALPRDRFVGRTGGGGTPKNALCPLHGSASAEEPEEGKEGLPDPDTPLFVQEELPPPSDLPDAPPSEPLPPALRPPAASPPAPDAPAPHTQRDEKRPKLWQRFRMYRGA